MREHPDPPNLTSMRTALVAAALLLTAGCSASPSPTQAPSTTHTANVADVAYLAAVRPTVQGSSDADLIALGKQACADLNGSTLLDVASKLQGQGMTTAAAAAIPTAAVTAYCPQHKDELTP